MLDTFSFGIFVRSGKKEKKYIKGPSLYTPVHELIVHKSPSQKEEGKKRKREKKKKKKS